MGRYGAKNSLTKAGRHFSQLFDSKMTWGLCCSGYVIFLVEGLNLQV